MNTPSPIDNINSLPAALFRTAEKYASDPAQWYRTDDAYQPVSYAQLSQRIKHFASGLIRAGIKPGDRVALLMDNCPEWAVIDYAILAIGAVTVPLYCSYRPMDMSHVLNDSGAITVITSGDKLLQSLLVALERCPDIAHVYAIENTFYNDHVQPMAELESGEIEEAELARRLAAIDRDTLATLAYTSGTTAQPKGVMLTHGNIITNLESVPAAIALKTGSDGDRLLSFLPLAHMLERTGSHFLTYSFGLSVAFAERPDTVAKNMAEARPNIMIVVPRMLEVIRARILAQIKQQPSIKQKLFHGYLAQYQKHKDTGSKTLLWHLLDKLVGQKIRQRFGGQLRVFICGGAPLNPDDIEFFEALGLPILEGYGLTESAPLLAVNPMSDRRVGTVGVAAKGVELCIADNGEILARGANIMPGYWRNAEITDETLIDGWLHTGDLGSICPDGYLNITGRKKDVIVNSGGENISPQRVESLLTSDDAIEQVAIYGDEQAYLVALVIPNEEVCMAWAKTQNLALSNWLQYCESDALKKHLQSKINTLLEPLNRFEQVRRIHLLPEPFSIEAGTLTPTMKVKRRSVFQHYAKTIISLYG
ncbi:MAG: long-chain fatty acid--CoA ligase [Mariprofundus sp.]|nr:long-chain fatty acid--CoA ligase [Mariprofundus sp.]